MAGFRSIQLHDYDNHNNRPVQPLNGRQIIFYDKEII
uniref:Uncharacterized protein n=1 Tax=Bracon brevicornis TaxID=1563983 RepID=A0A6V7KWV7_9HYME